MNNKNEIEKLVEEFVNRPLTEREFRKRLEELIKERVKEIAEEEK